MDKQVRVAFDNLVQWAGNSPLLGEIAAQPNGRHERTVSDRFREFLEGQLINNVRVVSEEARFYTRHQKYIHDILVLQHSATVAVVEVKTPFTNNDGIRNKTLKPEHLPKDMDALKAALQGGVDVAYSLITPIGCYPVDSQGEMIILNANSIMGNEKEVKAKHKIQWPTRPDYETSNQHGKQEVDRAMTDLAGERSLIVRRIKGWNSVDLPNPHPRVHAFMDFALYRVT